MNFKEKVLNFYENPEKFKEHRWIMLLVICGLTVSKDFIKRIIGANTYNIIIVCIMSLIVIYQTYGFIEYIKKNEKYDMKKDKSSIIISSMMILLSTSYLAFLLII